MSDFCVVADLEKFLQISIASGSDSTGYAEAAIRGASEAIRNYTKQTLDLVEDDEITLDLPISLPRIILPQYPVTEVSEVEEDGELLVADDDYILGQYGILHRIGRRWASGVQVVTITYSHGFSPIPDDIRDVCIRAASRTYQAGLRSSELGAIPGIQSETLGDHSVAYEQGAGGGESMMGASAAPILLRSEKAILDRYKL